MEHFKRSTARDFKIEMAVLEQKLNKVMGRDFISFMCCDSNSRIAFYLYIHIFVGRRTTHARELLKELTNISQAPSDNIFLT